MTYLNEIYNELKKFNAEGCGTFSLTGGNRVEIIDTPRMWGVDFESKKSIQDFASGAVYRLENIIRTIIRNAENYIDIVSLAPPEGAFYDAIIDELKTHFRKQATGITQVRFLFGYLPGGEDTVGAFRTKLENSFNNFKTLKLNLYVGRVHGGEKGGGGGPLSPWNHAKIVAADGKRALVGGHNLWPVGYGEYPPVHDLSLYIRGPAAKSAHEFADFMWTIPGNRFTGRPKWTRYYKFDFANGKFSKTWESSDPIDNWKNFYSEFNQPKFDLEDTDKTDIHEYESFRDMPFVTSDVKVLGVGRFPTEDSDIRSHAKQTGPAFISPSEKAKEFIITSAKAKLFICQQDLVFLGSTKEADHLVVNWIVEALAKNETLDVMIAVSPKNAKSKDGAQYSWGSGPLGTYQILENKIKKNYKPIQEQMLARLHVAPFCFTDVAVTKEGLGYAWVGTEKFSGKSARFATSVPMPRLLTFGEYPEPANHSKFYMAYGDKDSVYYVGSDNLYPHPLFEYGYLVDDQAAVKTMYEQYWSQVWKYSGKNCVCPNCRRSAYSVLVDSGIEYKATLGGYTRSPSQQSREALTLIESLSEKTSSSDQIDYRYVVLRLLNGEKAQYKAVPESCKSLKFPHGAIGKTFHAILLKNINDRYGSLSSFVKETGLSSSKPNLVENLVIFQKQPSVDQRYRSTFDNPKSELSEQVSEIINLTPKQIVDDNGFEVIPQAPGVRFIPGDGNCLFRAVSEAEYGAQDKHANLREQTCAYIRRNIDFYGAFGFDDNYLLRLRKNGFWGGNAEIEILSRLVNRKIIVYQPGGEIYMETPVDSASNPIYLLICNFRKPKQNDRESFNHFNLIASLDNWKKSL